MGVLSSGRDAPGMNAAIRAVTRASIFNGWKVMGIYRGYEGLINNEITEFTSQSVSNTIQRGGNVSLAGAQIFAKEYDVPGIGLPGTIDNDLYGTDYIIGYDTALNTIVEGVEIRHKLTKKGLVLLYRRVILSRSRPIGRWIQPVSQNGGQSSRPIR